MRVCQDIPIRSPLVQMLLIYQKLMQRADRKNLFCAFRLLGHYPEIRYVRLAVLCVTQYKIEGTSVSFFLTFQITLLIGRFVRGLRIIQWQDWLV